jgi:KUP system potassium uptake protein
VENQHSKVTFASLIVTLGIVYGDIGTSPLYVMNAIAGHDVLTKELIYGGLSLVFWTLTLQATFKYIFITLNADNNGEGGIFALYSLVRRRSPQWTIYVAMIGCAALVADGMITPAISLTSALEVAEKSVPGLPVVPGVIAILLALFMLQQFGTDLIGRFFGPIMLFWFLMLAVLGINSISKHPEIFAALNPWYAINIFQHHHNAWWVVGAVFLCVTGAEALYSDLGHVGQRNIQISWIFVKASLILTYLGQGAWMLDQIGHQLSANPFAGIMPKWFAPIGGALSVMAAIIASQALITGSFSLIHEAIRIKTWFRVAVHHPSKHRSQMYIPFVNWFLFAGCVFVVLYFKSSIKMEAAYGIAITIAMLSTTVLLFFYLKTRKLMPTPLIYLLIFLFLLVEGVFFAANAPKIPHGAGFTLILGGALFLVMYTVYNAKLIARQKRNVVVLEKYLPIIEAVKKDDSIPLYASNLVYLTTTRRKNMVEYPIVQSIFGGQPKRADVYWLVHFSEEDEPFTNGYTFTEIKPGLVYRLDFDLGYKVHPDVSELFPKAVKELQEKGLVNLKNHYPSLQAYNVQPDFKFMLLSTAFVIAPIMSFREQFLLRFYLLLKRIGVSSESHFVLEPGTWAKEQVVVNDDWD